MGVGVGKTSGRLEGGRLDRKDGGGVGVGEEAGRSREREG